MIYDYLLNIIDNKLSFGELDCVEENFFSKNGRSIYCFKNKYNELIESIKKIEKGIDNTNIYLKKTEFDINEFSFAILKKEKILTKTRSTECISINTIVIDKIIRESNKKWWFNSKRKEKYVFYKDNDTTFFSYNGGKRKYVPYNFKLVMYSGDTWSLEPYINVGILEYYKNEYQYLFKDYYNEYSDALKHKTKNFRLKVRQEALFTAKTKSEYVALTSKASKKIKGYNFNKHSFYTNYAVTKIFNSLDERSQNWIINQGDLYYGDGKGKINATTVPYICGGIINSNLQNNTNPSTSLYEANDYAEMCSKLRHKICIAPMSYKKLIELHDKESELLARKNSKGISDEPIIKIDTKFAKLYELMPKKFIPLTSERQLYIESQKQHNCVFANYTSDVKKDLCAIFHVSLSNNEYTLEIKMNGNKYYLAQLQKTYNDGYLQKDFDYIVDILNKVNKNQ